MATSRRRRSADKGAKQNNNPPAATGSDTPTPPGTTGRHIVLFQEGAAEAGAQAMKRVAGIKVARASDFEGKIRSEGLDTNEAMMFDTLAAVVVDSEPERIHKLQASSGGTIVAVEAERIVRATEQTSSGAGAAAPPAPASNYFDYARGYRDAVNHLLGQIIGDRTSAEASLLDVSVNAIDESQITWGLQVTNAGRSRFTGRGIRVAVLDTGFDLGHPDFEGRVIQSQTFVTDEEVQDQVGHGTHCIGTACGPRDPKKLPRYGIASAADIFVGKVLDNQGGGTDGSILAGIDWAVRKKCHVVSMSLGASVAPGTPFSAIFERVARRALAAGTLIVAAAGNDSARPLEIEPVNHPANCPSIMAVGAVDSGMRIAPFSCGGINPDGGEVDVAAPGVAITSSWPRPVLTRTISGTSMATPHVAGIAALLAEANPTVRGRELFDLIIRTARRMPFPPRDVGAGLVQAP